MQVIIETLRLFAIISILLLGLFMATIEVVGFNPTTSSGE